MFCCKKSNNDFDGIMDELKNISDDRHTKTLTTVL